MVLACIGLGSNLGQRGRNLRRAVQAIAASCGKIKDTSYLYESKAELVEDQPPFLNAAVAIDTDLGPLELLKRLQAIEHGKSSQRYGPRELDLDILLYGDANSSPIQLDELSIPHPRAHERDFVVKPLVDLSLGGFRIAGKRVDEHFALVNKPTTIPVAKFDALHGRPIVWRNADARSRIMGIINVTPDSFSDGGEFVDPDLAFSHAVRLAQDGASILDFGGESTRPGADKVSEQEELDRVMPLIERCRASHEFDDVVLSIDTYKPKVAEYAAKAGVDMVNDVSGGNDGILEVVAKYDLAVVLMHNRGDSKIMDQLTDYGERGVVASVAEWCDERVTHAVTNFGLPRWSLWVDPGFGFAKKPSQNFELLANLPVLLQEHKNVLVGTSRKRFLRRVMRFDQDVATCASTALGAIAGARLFRVHDVRKTVDTINVVDATTEYKQES